MNRGQYLSELRRSSAASPQDRKHELTDEEAVDEFFDFIEGIDYHPGQPHNDDVCTFGCWLNTHPEEKEDFLRGIANP